MTTAARVRYLIERHGDTIRSAAKRIGFAKSTLADLLCGSQAHLDQRIKEVARAYGVDPDSLVPGREPKADFEWSLRCATVRERFDFAVMTIQDRTRLTLEFLTRGYGAKLGDKQLAVLSGMAPKVVTQVMAQWDSMPPDLCIARSLVSGMHEFCDLELSWFGEGFLADESGLRALSGYVSAAALPALRVGKSAAAAMTGQAVNLARVRAATPIAA